MYGRKQCDPVSGCGKFYKQNADKCPHCGALEAFSSLIPFNPLDWVYDLESYPNIFTAGFLHPNSGHRILFEVSEWKNEVNELVQFLYNLKQAGCRLIGFNNVGYDYPMLHFIIENHYYNLNVTHIYEKNAAIINTPWHNRFENVIWDSDTHIRQIDLYKIHHFDNEARRTSLKMLEFNMCSDSVEDLPFPPGTVLTREQSRELVKYNWHDIDETEAFYIASIEMIEFREQLSEKYNANYMNHNDKKIGTSYLISELERLIPGSCYTRDLNNKKVPRQTYRDSINIGEIIFPYIQFKDPEFERIKLWLSSQVITETKGTFKDVSATIDGFKYDFGTGGIHGSIASTVVCSDDDFELWDWDVKSFYPQLAIKNKLFPEHLSAQFCDIYEEIYNQRLQHDKGTALNLALKLALNGSYGDSNSKFSPFYDPKFTMSITINGQLLLCMLAQYLIDIPGLTMVQINTDGMTVRCPRVHIETMKKICKWWEDYTCLELESAIYKRMFIRDVNNYIAEKTDGKLKRKGAYAYERISENPHTQERQWHQNHSSLVVPKAAEAALVHGQCIDDFIRNHDNIFDFMLRTKVGRSDQLIISDQSGNEKQLQKITRYYIGTDGGSLTKISPPAKGHKVGTWKRKNGITDEYYRAVLRELKHYDKVPVHDLDSKLTPWDERINTKNRSKYEIRRTNFNTGWLVAPCNNMVDADRSNINFDYYIAEAEKLVNPLRG